MRPKLGVIDFHPIQYRAPLYQRLASRGNVQLDVLFLSDVGYRAVIDPGFGMAVSWNIDLMSGYANHFLTSGTNISKGRHLVRWIGTQDAVIVHGYVHPWMLFAMAVCRARSVPYLLRGESHPQGQATGLRGRLRDIIARGTVSGSAGGLAIGELNAAFYRRYGARRITFAPYSVDDERFAGTPPLSRGDLLARWGLDDSGPLIIFCGKLIPRKRPLDLIAAISRLPDKVVTLFVGNGSISEQVQASLSSQGAVTGFVNQSELPAYYHAADILVLPSEAEPWGLVVNEAMAAGVLPVVSDRVGAGPDLVRGIGEIYPCGDVAALAGALSNALAKLPEPGLRDRVRRHAARYSLDTTAAGFEDAVLALRTSPS